MAPNARLMPVVKANAYGLGAVPIVRTMIDEGYKEFFVAYPQHAAELIAEGINAVFYCYNARPQNGGYSESIRPVLTSIEDLSAWAPAPCGVQIDIGMNRLGLCADELNRIPPRPDVEIVVAHMSHAGNINSPVNTDQRTTFETIRPRLKSLFPNAQLSLSASGNVLLGNGPQEDAIRPGISLYGGTPGMQAATEHVVSLEAQILSVRHVPKGETVGYDGTWTAPRDSRIATLAIGYADGLPRSLRGGHVTVQGQQAPIVGAISMDLTTVDVTEIDQPAPGAWAEVFGHAIKLDTLAKQAGTIGYEILTRLGDRAQRIYCDD